MTNTSTFPCISAFLQNYNITQNIPNSADESFCTTILDLQIILGLIFRHICLVLIIFMILISIFGHINENYKWFVLYAACCNFLLIFYNDFSLLFNLTIFFQTSTVNDIIGLEITNLARLSSIPLVFNRFFFLYFRDFYPKLFTRGGIFSLTIGYGIIICIILPILRINQTFLRIFVTGLLIISVFISIFVYIRLRTIMKIST